MRLFKYSYNGPVMEFDNLICEKWSGETVASSDKKAKSNLTYQFKKKHNRTARTKITLPGKIKIIEEII